MPTKTVHAPNFPVGTSVKAFGFEATRVEREEGRVPFAPMAADDGVIDADHNVDITAAAGAYALLGVVDEVQSVKIDATAGQFKLTFSGQQTANIAFNAAASAVQTALEALSNIDPGDVSVSGGPGDSGGTTPYLVTFSGQYAGTNVAALTGANGTTPLSGGGAAITITTSTQGAEGTSGELLWLAFTID
jgi:hypothetical protein